MIHGIFLAVIGVLALAIAFQHLRSRQTRRAFLTASERLGAATERLNAADFLIARQAETISALKAREQKREREMKALEARGQRGCQAVANVRNGLRGLRNDLDLGGKALLPAPAIQVVNGQRIGKNTVRVTGRLV